MIRYASENAQAAMLRTTVCGAPIRRLPHPSLEGPGWRSAIRWRSLRILWVDGPRVRAAWWFKNCYAPLVQMLKGVLAYFRQPSAMPLRVFVAVLLLVFTIEYAIMLLLASITPPRAFGASMEVWDATLLTVLLAPALWWLVVRPLQNLFEARGRLLSQLFQAQEEERGRIARDLHDELGQQLTAIMIGLRTAQEAPTLEACRDRSAAAARIGADALESVRVIVRGLRPGVLEDLGLVPAVERLCEDFRAVHDVDVSLRSTIPPERRFAPPVEMCLYRMLQESLTNAARHSGATSVGVSVSAAPSSLQVEVTDDGRGFDTSVVSAGSSGLSGMRERVTMLGGVLRVESAAGSGTRVFAQIPIDDRWMHVDDGETRAGGRK